MTFDTALESFNVGELISTQVAIPPQLRVEEVVNQFFHGHNVEALAIVEDGRILGLALRIDSRQSAHRDQDLFYSSNDETCLRLAIAPDGADNYICKGDISGMHARSLRC